jgi:hypothetical protein
MLYFETEGVLGYYFSTHISTGAVREECSSVTREENKGVVANI